MTGNVPVKFLFEVSNNMVSGDGSEMKGTQLSFTEESYINKESEKQLRSRYDQFTSSKYVAVSRLNCYRSNPDLTTVLMGRLTYMQTLLCKIITS